MIKIEAQWGVEIPKWPDVMLIDLSENNIGDLSLNDRFNFLIVK